MASETKRKWLKFLGGFMGWFLVSTWAFALADTGSNEGLWLIYLPVNVVAMVALAFWNRTKWISLGIVSAMAVNFFIALLIRPTYEAFCFVPVTYPRFPARTVTQPTPVGRPPVGYHDGNAGRVNQANCAAFGWAVDPDNRDKDVNVRVLSDGEAAAQTVANAYRPDLNVPDGCPGGTCGFRIELWRLISHDAQHIVRVEAQDVQTGAWKDLSATPKTLVCGN